MGAPLGLLAEDRQAGWPVVPRAAADWPADRQAEVAARPRHLPGPQAGQRRPGPARRQRQEALRGQLLAWYPRLAGQGRRRLLLNCGAVIVLFRGRMLRGRRGATSPAKGETVLSRNKCLEWEGEAAYLALPVGSSCNQQPAVRKTQLSCDGVPRER